jgi:hypothetical protein
MQRNEGTIDRLVRAGIAAVAVAAALGLGVGTVGGIVLLVVAAVMLVTAAVGFCPLYAILGVSTCPAQRH